MRPPERRLAFIGLIFVVGVWALVLLASSSTLQPASSIDLPTQAVLPTLTSIPESVAIAENPADAQVASSTIEMSANANTSAAIIQPTLLPSPDVTPSAIPSIPTTTPVSNDEAQPEDNKTLPESPGGDGQADANARFNALASQAQQTGEVTVLVRLNVGHTPEALLSNQSVRAQRNLLRSSQNALLTSLATQNPKLIRTYQTLPFVAVSVDQAGLQALRQSPLVASISSNIRFDPVLDVSTPLIDAPDAWSMGYDGTGQVVAVIDSGVPSGHPFLAGHVMYDEGACFSSEVGGYFSMCPTILNQEIGPGAGEPCYSFVLTCDHGTHVGGIVAGNATGGFSGNGVAPGAQILPIMAASAYVCFVNPIIFCSGFQLIDLAAALDYVNLNRNTYDIAAVNMSLGGGIFGDYCDDFRNNEIDYRDVTSALQTLALNGIAPVIATGNDGASSGISAPGCISYAFAVGSSTKSNRVSNFSNSSAMVDFLAPGSAIRSSVPGGGFETWNGTSMAAPHIAGALAILRQADNDATVSELYKALAISGLPIRDSRNNITRPRVDVDDAVNALLSGAAAVPDDFDDAEPIETFPFEELTYTFFATNEIGEDTTSSCTGLGPISNLWYIITADGPGQININTNGSDFDTVLVVYTGTQLNNLVEVACDNNSGSGTQSALSFNATDGTTYYIQVGGDDNDRGRLMLNLSAPLTTPELVSPVNAFETTTITQPTFEWDAVLAANVYDIEVDDNVNFSSPEYASFTSNTDITPALPLDNATYYWRVRARNAAETSPWSDVWSFAINVERFADLVIDKSAAPDPAIVNNPFTYTITVTNNGPDKAKNIIVTDNLPLGVILDSATPSQGSCNTVDRVVTCNLGDLWSGENATVMLAVRSVINESIFNSASVTSDATETVPGDNSIEIKTIIDPPPGTRMIRWAGIDWYVKAANTPVGPGPNRFSDSTDSVWVDSNGNLHMEIVKIGSQWYSAEIFSVERSSYGMHRFYVDSSLNEPDSNAVLGLFLYQDDEHEIDFESALWGNPSDVNNAQFVLQPWDLPGNRERFNIDNPGPTLHEIDWQAGQVDYRSLYGHDPGGSVIHDYSITSAGVPAETRDLRIRLNLWLYQSSAPANGQPVHVILYDLDAPIKDAQADLGVTKTSVPAYASPGQELTYQLRVTNHGLDRASEVELTDVLPGDVTFISAEPAGLCTHVTGTMTCELGDLGPGKWRNINLKVNVSAAATGTLSNTASVDSAVLDPVSSNDSAALELPVLLALNAPTMQAPTVLSRNQIQLDWTDNSPGQSSIFRLQRSMDSGATWQTIHERASHITRFVDSNLLCNQGYDYRVFAVRTLDSAVSAASNVVNATTLACPAPVLHTAGVFANGHWEFWDALSSTPADLIFNVGPADPGWTAVVGDWDGDGIDGIGLYKNGLWLLRNVSNGGVIETQVHFGPAESGWLPIVGDWNGDGTDGIGLYKNSLFKLRNSVTSGIEDWSFTHGPTEAGWQAVAGDWNGSGQDTVGVYRNGLWLLTNSTPARADFPPVTFGESIWKPVAGDWDEDGTDGIGLFAGGIWHLRNTASAGTPEISFNTTLGAFDWQPLASYRGGLGPLTILSQVITTPPTATPLPTASPDPETEAPLPEATAEPTAEPTTVTPVVEVTEEPTLAPTAEPTVAPTLEPTIEPTTEPLPEPPPESTEESG